jgi:uncharacterized protein YkwD
MTPMNTGRLLLGLGAGVLVAGCGSPTEPERSAASPAAAVTAPKQAVVVPLLADAGGHPLSLPSDDPGTLSFESELSRLVNDHRASLGLPALQDSPPLGGAARAHSRHMILHEFFAHTSPEGLSPGDRLKLDGIAWSSVGENIAADYATPQAVFDAWMASPGHRENMESPLWTHVGTGYALNLAPSEEFPHAHVWTQNFVRATE